MEKENRKQGDEESENYWFGVIRSRGREREKKARKLKRLGN